MKFNLEQKQVQTISAQVIQQMEILQLNSQELLEHIEATALENPVLEVSNDRQLEEEYTRLERQLNWLASSDVQNHHYYRQDSEFDNDPLHNLSAQEENETLYQYVLSQLSEIDLPKNLYAGVVFPAQSLNKNGWLDEDMSLLSSECTISRKGLYKALNILQSMDPPGIGARNLSECLVLQLKRTHPDYTLAIQIAEDHLESMARGQFSRIAQELNSTVELVSNASALIRTLNPKPGTGYGYTSQTTYIIPDLIITMDGNTCNIHTNEFFNLGISDYYARMMRECSDEDTKRYLLDKVKQAKFLIRAVSQRRSTVVKCVEHILDIQKEFFTTDTNHLAPLTLSDVAASLGVRESTISRALKNKYLQCTKGVFPLNFFFSRAVGFSGDKTNAFSAKAAKELLRQMVAQENPQNPLSDQRLSEMMKEKGCAISRRTIAKYRDELGIQNTAARKKR